VDTTDESVAAALLLAPRPLRGVCRALPDAPGLYAWWATFDVLAELPGPVNPAVPGVRLLYLGKSERPLNARVCGEHLRYSRRSTLRRVLAGLLMAAEGYRTMWTDRVVLVPEDEERLTGWMRRHLTLTWATLAAPGAVEAECIRRWRPPLNVKGAQPGPVLERVKAARAAYRAGAGTRPVRERGR
jgi:hypothetical protein